MDTRYITPKEIVLRFGYPMQCWTPDGYMEYREVSCHIKSKGPLYQRKGTPYATWERFGVTIHTAVCFPPDVDLDGMFATIMDGPVTDLLDEQGYMCPVHPKSLETYGAWDGVEYVIIGLY